MMAKFTYPIDDPHDLLGTAERRIDALEAELKEERYATEQFRRANEGLAASKEKLEVALTLERQRTGRVTSELLKSGDLVEIAGEFVPRSQLEDDVLRFTISLLKNENERLTKYVEYSKDDKECMQNEIDVLKSENEALSELLSPLVDVELDRDTLKSALDVAMSENQRLTKHVEDYEEENATLKAKLEAIECAGCGKTMLECECDMESE